MALRPFSRQPKDASEEESPPEVSGEAESGTEGSVGTYIEGAATLVAVPDQLPDPVPAAEVPTVDLPDQAGPGWYRDTADERLMRYWDGFHLTGQVMHVHARAGDADDDAPPTSTITPDESSNMFFSRATDVAKPPRPETPASEETASIAGSNGKVTLPAPPPPVKVGPVSDEKFDEKTAEVISILDLDRSVSGQPSPMSGAVVAAADATAEETEVKVEAEVEAEVKVEAEAKDKAESESAAKEDGAGAVLVAATFETDGAANGTPQGTQQAPSRQVPPVQTPGSRGPVETSGSRGASDGVEDWAEETERAVARATADGTPELWQEAARAAAVVSEMALTMQAAAGAAQVAEQLDQAAVKAAREAQIAAQEAADAERSAQKTAEEARKAAEAAKVAEQAAADAKRTAQQTAEEAPKLDGVAKVAAEVAAEAERKSASLAGIVAQARSANTPDAWSEALTRASEESEKVHQPV
jgi:hypothetical protein